MKVTAKRLAEIAEKTPGYVVTLTGHGDLSDIRFRRSPSGRRDRFVVEGMNNGALAVWPSDTLLEIDD